jgi:flagellar basal body P-ring protein FlgI
VADDGQMSDTVLGHDPHSLIDRESGAIVVAEEIMISSTVVSLEDRPFRMIFLA